MATALELLERMKEIRERQKVLVDTAEHEDRSLTAEEMDNFTRADTDLTALEKRLELQRKLETTEAAAGDTRGKGPQYDMADLVNQGWRRDARFVVKTPEYRQAFDQYLTFGAADMDPRDKRTLQFGMTEFNEQRIMTTGNDVSAGYLIPETYYQGIIRNMLEFGGMREAATVFSTPGGNDLVQLVSDDTANVGELLNEGATVTAQDVTVGRRILKAYTFSTKEIIVSRALLQDAQGDIFSDLIAPDMAERLARITNQMFTTGTGANQPTGVVTDAGTGVSGATGQATTVTGDNLIALQHAVNPAYRNGAGVRWMFHDDTLRIMRQLKDGNGNYLWQPGLTSTAPATILGKPYTINQDVAQMAASAVSILFGDFKKYRIRDVMGLAVLRLDEVYARQFQVAFIGFSRHDGLLINSGTNPIQAYVNAAS